MLSITRNSKDESAIIYVEPHKGAEARCGIWMDGWMERSGMASVLGMMDWSGLGKKVRMYY